MNFVEISLDIPAVPNSSTRTAISATSAQSPAAVLPAGHPPRTPIPHLVTVSVACYVRRGTSPTAVNDGTDMPLLANNTYRVQLLEGERIAFITDTGTGTASLTANA